MVIAANEFDVESFVKEVTAIETELASLVKGLTEAQFHAPPRNGGWSAAHCIEHLVLSGHWLVQRWDAAIRGRASNSDAGEPSNRPHGWLQRALLSCAENSTVLRIRTQESLIPYARHSIDETRRRLARVHHEMGARGAASRGMDLRRTKVQSLCMPWMSHNLAMSFDLAMAHERRHLAQAWRVRRQVTGGDTVRHFNREPIRRTLELR